LTVTPEHESSRTPHSRPARAVAGITGAAITVYALGLFFGLPAFRRWWIWPAAPALGLAFVGSWLAGLAAPLLWIGLTGRLRAIQGGALGGVVAFGGSGALLWAGHSLPGKERFLAFAVLFMVGALAALAAFIWSTRVGRPPDRVSPRAVRWTFLLFSAILFPVGLGMAWNAQRIFPMPLAADTTRLYGWFFLGSCIYYFFGFLKPSMLNSTGHLLSFLVYDALLIPPFARYWPAVPAEFRLSLFLYLAVLVTSAVFCIYFLFVDPRTRLFEDSSRA
jgi:MFS family permease